MNFIKRIIERKRLEKNKREWKEYYTRMDQLQKDFIKDNNLLIGGRYSGRLHYWKGVDDSPPKIIVGTLLELEAGSDGIFASLKQDDGTIVSDVNAETLTPIIMGIRIGRDGKELLPPALMMEKGMFMVNTETGEQCTKSYSKYCAKYNDAKPID